MYAVIETGGKQYRVEVGTELEVERLDAATGDTVAFDRVLLIADGETAAIGTPVVANGSVAGEILRRDRGEKVISFKYRPKARRRVKKGHRQELTVVRISDIVLDGKSAAKEVAAAEQERQTERQRLEQAARRQAEQDAALAAKLAAEKPAKAEVKGDAEKKTKTTAKRGTAKADTTETAEEEATARKTSTKSSTAAKPSSARKSNKD
ncbi:MAG TPA: 50S ribosomal protein L21 [Candidatus Limnocylindrales bacterium]|nr:50S ribosomal protein L21 [Candidatus Limnocylindrales bacterium]